MQRTTNYVIFVSVHDLVTKFPLFKNNSTGLPCSPIKDVVTEDVDVGEVPKRNN